MTYAYVEFSSPINDYCELESWSFSNMHPTPAAGGSSAGVGRALTNDFRFVTADNYLRTDLFEAVSHGNTYKKVGVFLYTDKGDLYLYYKLTNAVVMAVQTSGTSKVSASVNFASMSYEYFET